MTANNKPSVLIAESDQYICGILEQTLKTLQWDIVCQKSVSSALTSLKNNSLSAPFFLIISGFTFEDGRGVELLAQAENTSPFTMRMLLLPFEENQALIDAINSAGIHACITYPFKTEDLISQVKHCHTLFLRLEKKEQLKRIISRQNSQLYEATKTLKEKEKKLEILFKNRKKKLIKLKIEEHNQNKKDELSSRITLAGLIDNKKTAILPEAFLKEFISISGYIKQLLQHTASKHSIVWKPKDIDAICKEKLNYKDEHEKNEYKELMQTIKKYSYIYSLNKENNVFSYKYSENQYKESDIPQESKKIEDYLELTISDTLTTAWLKQKKELDKDIVNTTSILYFLKEKNICYGIIDKDAIEKWLWGIESNKNGQSDQNKTQSWLVLEENKQNSNINSGQENNQNSISAIHNNDFEFGYKELSYDKFVIAQGKSAFSGKKGEIHYFFKTDYTNPGKIREDGSIDFRDKGDMPHIKKGNIVAIKTAAEQPMPGIDIYGVEIPVDAVFDLPFAAGSGTVLSDDGLKIFAAIDGQPHVDFKGNITVNEELVIKGDVDLKTGNILFEGNVIVKGAVKNGMVVKGVSLTADEIDGAVLELTGDLNVTYGISHAAVKTVANIHTKFISDSNITGFNNVTVQKEIIESNLLINGNCSLNGKLISSNVSAKQGVEARQIGTESSVPPVNKVGTDYLIEVLEEKINSDIEETRNQIIKLKNQIELLSKKDKTIFKNITDLVQIMDKTRLEINQSKKQLAELNQLQSGGTDSLKSLSEAINKLETKSKKAEASVDRLFQEKDHIELEKEKLKESIEVYENKNTDFVNEKKILKEYLRKMPPDPTVAVQGKIIKGTSITGPNSSFILKTDYTKCVIQEQKFEKDDQTFFDMVIKS